MRDEGFRPADVQQGGVGDCWFMSALAVVAERHDLMCKLLPNMNAGAESGCHEVRLFLDGRWTSLLVDDYLPTTTKQRRPTADGSGLAFGRCARRQLWVSLIEKAYAKAHGAYRFISGGETSEALLELTGAPTEVVQFRDPSFDPELFWARLVSLLQAGCPIGCGTGAETLEELGLVGQHAYSVLETDSTPVALGLFEERRVKVRNPWGEWTRREQDELLAQLGAAVVPDEGSFWMNYGDFIKGFAVADICYARDGWHARSFDAEFAAAGTGSRTVLQLRASCGVECWVMAIQPTERGKQLKRPPGYYLNDISLLIFEESETSAEPTLVKAAIGGARRDVVCSVVLEADKTYKVMPVSFRASRGSFVLRLYSASPIQVREEVPSAALAWSALHRLVAAPEPPQGVLRRVQDFGVGRLLVLEGPAMALGVLVNLGPVGLAVDLGAFGNHAALRSAGGIQEGTVDEDRNRQDAKGAAKGKEKGKKQAKADWRRHGLHVLVPPFAQRLAFVAVALLEKNWEFSLESLDAEQVVEESSESAQPAQPGTNPFAPVALPDADRHDLDGLEEFEEMELQAALQESARLAEADRKLPEAAQQATDDTSDDELELALRLSLADAKVDVPAVQEEPHRAGRWSRRNRLS